MNPEINSYLDPESKTWCRVYQVGKKIIARFFMTRHPTLLYELCVDTSLIMPSGDTHALRLNHEADVPDILHTIMQAQPKPFDPFEL